MELAEERSLLSDADAYMVARAGLINPRKRISAEMAWMPGVAPERVYDMLLLLEASAGKHLTNDKPAFIVPVGLLSSSLSCLPNARTYNVADKILDLLKSSEGDFTKIGEFLGIHTLTPIARVNLLAARMLRLPDYRSDVVAEWILSLTQAFETIDPSEVCAILNAEREESGFPEITELSDITSEIRNCRRYYQQVIKFALDSIPSAKERAKAVMTAVDLATDSETKHWPILIEDTIDAYEDGVAVFLETEGRNIETQNRKIRIAVDAETSDAVFMFMVDELLQTVKDWEVIAQPIQLNRNRQGLRHDESHDVADRIRLLAIFLFNEYDKLYFSQKILNALQEVFSEIPAISERITADLETLNRIAEQREQQIF